VTRISELQDLLGSHSLEEKSATLAITGKKKEKKRKEKVPFVSYFLPFYLALSSAQGILGDSTATWCQHGRTIGLLAKYDGATDTRLISG
jgi:hypothetical protein